MKAEFPSPDKGPGAGRPRDPRIDAAILQATTDLLVQIGYANLTLAAVAERAGTTKSALYRRWSSKAELVHEAAFAMPPSALTSSTGGVTGDLTAMVAGARDVFTNPVVRAALPGLIADMANDAELTDRVLARFKGHFDVLRQWVAQAVDRGDARPEVDAERLLEVIAGAALFGLMLRPDDDLDGDWVDQTTAIVARGVVT